MNLCLSHILSQENKKAVRPEDFGPEPSSVEIQKAYDEAGDDGLVCFTPGRKYPIDQCVEVKGERTTTIAHGAVIFPVGESLTGKKPMIDLNEGFDGTISGSSVNREVKWFGGTFGKNATLTDAKSPAANAFGISGLRAGGVFGAYFISIRNPLKGAIADSFRVRDCYFRNHLVGIYSPDELDATPQDLWINNNTFASSRLLNIPEMPYSADGVASSFPNIANGFCDDDIVDFNDNRFYVVNANAGTFQISNQQGGTPIALPAASGRFRLIPAAVMLDGNYSNMVIRENNIAAKFGSAVYATTGGKRGNADNFKFLTNATEQMTGERVIWVDDVSGANALGRITIKDNDLASGSAETIYIDSLGNSAQCSMIEGNEFTSRAGTHITVNSLNTGSKLKVDCNTMNAETASGGKILQVNSGAGKVYYGHGNAEPVDAGSKIAPNIHIDPEL